MGEKSGSIIRGRQPGKSSMRTGSCQCGSVRFECAARPLELYICHCTECRRQSASAFGISFIVPRDSFRLLSGTPRYWARDADSGGKVECAFCPDCGTRLWHQDAADSRTMAIKGGSLDDPPSLSRAHHIWTKRKLEGMVILEGARAYPEEP